MTDDGDPSGNASETENASAADRGADTADTMRGRAGESRLKLWVLLRANRLVVAGGVTVVVFVAFVAVASGQIGRASCRERVCVGV